MTPVPVALADSSRERGLWDDRGLADGVDAAADARMSEQLVIWEDPLPRTPSGTVVRSGLVMEAPGRPTARRRTREKEH
jgi:hypothetical protein